MGAVGVTGTSAANRLAEEADVVLAVGTRLQDFTTGSWALFKNDAARRSSGSTCSLSMPASTARCRWSPTRAEGLTELDAGARRLEGAGRLDRQCARTGKAEWQKAAGQGHRGRPMPRCRPTRR